eukprot:6286477-Amphidinium_carterae.1
MARPWRSPVTPPTQPSTTPSTSTVNTKHPSSSNPDLQRKTWFSVRVPDRDGQQLSLQFVLGA